MVDNLNLIIVAVIIITILLFVISFIVFIYKILNSLREKRYELLFNRYSKEIFEIITGKKEHITAKDFGILSDCIIMNFYWIDGEEKELLHQALSKTTFFDTAVRKIIRGRKGEKIRYAKALSIVGKTSQLKRLVDLSLKNPMLIDITSEAIFRNVDEVFDIGYFKPYIRFVLSNISKYPDYIRKRIEFFAVTGAAVIKDIVMHVVFDTDDEKVVISCLNILSEAATYEDIIKLTRFANHPSAEVRSAFCRVIEKTGAKDVEGILINMIENDKVNFVKLRALRALSTNFPRISMKFLLRALEDEWFFMRDFSRKILSEMGPVVLDELLDFYYKTNDRFAKDKVVEIFYDPVNFEYIIKNFLGYGTKQENILSQSIVQVLVSSNKDCFVQRLKEDGYSEEVLARRL